MHHIYVAPLDKSHHLKIGVESATYTAENTVFVKFLKVNNAVNY